MINITIIGGGVTGCLVARELSRYQLDVLLIEKDNDIANGTTKANSAIVHAGYDAKPGTLKAWFNVAGNALFDTLCRELNVPFKRIGSLVLGFSESEMHTLKELQQRGTENGVPGLTVIGADEVARLEPHRADTVVGALYAPTGGIVGPWELAIAAAENAMDNGVKLMLNTAVSRIEKIKDGYRVTAGGTTIETRCVINCAGLYADSIHNMVAEPAFSITPRRGEYYVLDHSEGDFVNHVIFQCPTPDSKGVLITPTVHGNLLVGPNAETVEGPEHRETTAAGLKQVREVASKSTGKINFGATITSFAGLRATPDTGDFIIGEAAGAPGFIDVAGIESPGLTAAPAIAVHVAELVQRHLGAVAEKPDFNPVRKPMVHFAHMSSAKKAELIAKDARFGRVICRCESITEGEILDAIHRNAGAATVDGVKRRVRPGMGRCQGGFCGPRVVEILARELHLPLTAVKKDGLDSTMLTGETKETEAPTWQNIKSS